MDPRVQTVKVAACQTPDIREDIDGALSWIEEYGAKAAVEGAHLLCFPECFLQGYLTDEESARRHAVNLASEDFRQMVERLSGICPVLVFGLIEIENNRLYNTAVVVDNGIQAGRYRKMHPLPGEHIFDPGDSYPVFDVGGLRFGINICYDTNFPEAAAALAAKNADLIVCPANNMMPREKAEYWKYRHNKVRAQRAAENGVWLISSDVTGERGDRISYGPTSVINPEGHVTAQVPLGEVGMVTAEITPRINRS